MGLKQPIAVLISDVHYSVQTLEVADRATNLAVDKANELGVSLIVAGDLHDTKANMRGECVKVMLDTFQRCVTPSIILVGNHDKINEKSEGHSLEFLRHVATIIAEPVQNLIPYWTLIPYQHDKEVLKDYLKTIKYKNVIMHQGITGSNSGEYIQDKSAITKDDVAGFRVVSGHYHQRQTIKLPENGTWDYIGNPYTLNFGEANVSEKGYQILYDDGSLKFVPTNLRKHVVISVLAEGKPTEPWNMNLKYAEPRHTYQDIIKFTIKGPKEWLAKLEKKQIAKGHDITQDFRLDLIPIESKSTLVEENVENLAQPELLDSLIDSMTNMENDQKSRLKTLWKEFAR